MRQASDTHAEYCILQYSSLIRAKYNILLAL